MLKAGNCFLCLYPPGSGKTRRFIVLTDEVNGECTVVWVFTSTQIVDETCVLAPGDHTMISHRCSVVYEMAVIASADRIRQGVATKALNQVENMEPSLVKRIFDGLFASELTPLEVLDYCQDR